MFKIVLILLFFFCVNTVGYSEEDETGDEWPMDITKTAPGTPNGDTPNSPPPPRGGSNPKGKNPYEGKPKNRKKNNDDRPQIQQPSSAELKQLNLDAYLRNDMPPDVLQERLNVYQYFAAEERSADLVYQMPRFKKMIENNPDSLQERRRDLLAKASKELSEVRDFYNECFDDCPSSDYGLGRAHSPLAKEIVDRTTLASVLIELAVDTTINLTIGWPRDMYEAISGHHILTGDELNSFDRGMAIAGAMSGGVITKFAKPLKMIGKLSYNTIKNVLTKTRTSEKALEIAKNLNHNNAPEVVEEIRNFFKKHKVPDERIEDFTNAFSSPTKVTVLEKDTKVYRYYDAANPNSNPRGRWLSPNKCANPQAELALENAPHHIPAEWIIPKGTEVLEGRIAPRYNQVGGGYQYYVPNPEVLKEVLK